MEEQKIRVGITHGDINGVGYEVILKTLCDARIVEMCTPVVYGSAKIASYYRKSLDLSTFNYNTVENATQLSLSKVNIVNCVDDELKVECGKSTTQSGAAAYKALECAVADLKQGLIDVLVTAPINKINIQSSNFIFPGHTEYLEERLGEGEKSLMILLKDDLRVALVTGHIPLSKVAESITKEAILSKLNLFNQSLIQDFGYVRPRIALLSLNPHAGENGLLGSEEKEIIEPAIQSATSEGLLCFGPYAADGFFGSGLFKKFDGILAMYHDQGLVPFKTMAMEDGVNFTAGLPFVRTSPAHGTAYDIAGQNIADENSFRQSLYTAIDVFSNRQAHAERTQNPLRRQYFDKSGDRERLNLSAE